MSDIFSSSLNLTQLLIIIAFFTAILCLEKKKTLHQLLMLTLTSSVLAEFIAVIFIINNIDYGLLYSISTLIHNIIWLIILGYVINRLKVLKYLIVINICFAIVNLFMLEGTGHFNNYTFVFSAFLYLTIFIIASFKELKKENFHFFYSNTYLLLLSPILFFLGLSFYFGFKDSDLGDIKVIGQLYLYDILIYFVNIIYYSLLIVYIIREKKIRNAKK